MASQVQSQLKQQNSLQIFLPFILENIKRSEILVSITQLLHDSFIFGLQFGRFQYIHTDEETMLQCLQYTRLCLRLADDKQIDKIPLITEFLKDPQAYFHELIQKKIKHKGITIIMVEYPFDSLIRQMLGQVYQQQANFDPVIYLENALLLGIECARLFPTVLEQNQKIVEYLKRVYKLLGEFDDLHQALNQIEIRNQLISQYIASQNFNIEESLQENIDLMTLQLTAPSQIQKSIFNEPSQQCKICLNLCEIEFYISFTNCSHCFHRECLLKFCSDKILGQLFPITCPIPECKVEILDRDLQNILQPNQYEEYLSKTLKKFIDSNPDEFSSCPTAGCQNIFGKRGSYFKCTECHKQYCLECRVEYHVALSCEEYKAKSVREKDEVQQDYLFLKFVQGQNFKQCPQCQFWIEKSQGCNHMSCRCKYQFCYACGGPYPKCNCINGARALG